MNFITEWGKIAGIAGIALGIFLVLFREVIRKNIFPKLNRKQSFTIILSFMGLAFAMGIFSIVQYNISLPKGTQLTVYVHGAKGKQDIVLENTGRLVVDFGNDRRTPNIGQNGRTNFGEIPDTFMGKEIGIGIIAQGYVLSDPKKRYVMDGNPIYLAVKKDGRLGEISGIVKSRDGSRFIENAQLLINNDTIIKTNKQGIFKIVLPETMQVKNQEIPYLLTVIKSGYKTTTVYYTPNSGNMELRLNDENN